MPTHQHQKNLHLVAFSACGDGDLDYFLTHQANNRTITTNKKTMKIKTIRNGSKLTNEYHLSPTQVLRDTVGENNSKGEPVATLISGGQSDQVRYPAAVLSFLTRGLKIPAEYFPCMD